MRKSISISLSKEILAELDELSRARGITRSDVIRSALKDYLFIQKFRIIRNEMRLYAEDQGIFTDEDVFQRTS